MFVAGRRRSIVFSIILGAGLVAVILLLYIGWVLLNWRTGILLFFGVLVVAMIIAGVVLNTTFLVRELRRNEQRDAFINAVTHELKTPIASIRLYLETLQTRPVDDAKRQEFYGTMVEDCERLLSTIEQVLRTGRIGSTSRHKLNRIRMDVNEVVEECLTKARAMYRLPEEALEFHPGPRAAILADPDEVRAAVTNLIDNAIKYSGSAGSPVKVTVETASIDGRFVSVRVKDQGVGIPKIELKQIFKRFYRVRGPLAARIKGTGLGLFIVRSVAKRHGGRAWAESEGPGRGSTFILQLPVVR